VTVESSTPARTGAVERFHRFCVKVVARLPLGLSSVVAPTFLGFCLINSCTFGVDLVLLYVMHGWLNLPVPIAVTVAYACAFALSYVLNRIFNFQSHAPVGPQLSIYVVVVVVNYLAFILGLVSLLTYLGIDYRIARLMAGACEAVYMYSMMRWVVFRG
jgi:putative flippase GtrA